MTQANNPNAAVSTERLFSANPRQVFAAFEQPERLVVKPWYRLTVTLTTPRRSRGTAHATPSMPGASRHALTAETPAISVPLTEAEPKEKEASALPEAAAKAEAKKERTPRLDWAGLLRRTFALDVFACVRCGGKRGVLAYVKQAGGVRAILEHLGLPTAGASLTDAGRRL